MAEKDVSKPLGVANCDEKIVCASCEMEQQYDEKKKPVLVAEGAVVVDLSFFELMKEINMLREKGIPLSKLENVAVIKAQSNDRSVSQPETKNKADEGFGLDD